MADPLDFETLPRSPFTGLRVDPVLAYEQEILDAVDRYYGESDRTPIPISMESVGRVMRISSIFAIWRARRP